MCVCEVKQPAPVKSMMHLLVKLHKCTCMNKHIHTYIQTYLVWKEEELWQLVDMNL